MQRFQRRFIINNLRGITDKASHVPTKLAKMGYRNEACLVHKRQKTFKFYSIHLFTLCLMVLVIMGNTPTPTPDPNVVRPYETTAYRRLIVYKGPGETHPQADILNAGIPVTIIERNHTGNWVRVVRKTEDGTVAMDGWVISAFLNQDENMKFSQVPVNRSLPDHIPENIQDGLSIAELYSLPVMPEVSDEMIEIYKRGQFLGNHSNVITKVGDSLSASDKYLTIFAHEDYDLGPYDYLEDTLNYYGASVSGTNVASRIGLSTYVVFDPLWADKELCLPNESPLDCEYRIKQPSVSFILFGPNDVRSMTEVEYGEQMRMIVEATLERGIIPVVFTFSSDPDVELWWQSINFNREIKTIAEEYKIPVINLWVATRLLPDYGLDIDGIHLAHSGYFYLKFSYGDEAFYGVTLQNLLALRMLDEIRKTVGIDINGDPT